LSSAAPCRQRYWLHQGHCSARRTRSARKAFRLHFQQDKDKRLSPRTARTYMQLARNWSRLTAQHPEGLSSQRQALKALAAIVQTDEPAPDAASPAARSQSAVASSAARCQSAVAGSAARCQSAVASSAARGQSAGRKRGRTGPVSRASGPFVREARRRG